MFDKWWFWLLVILLIVLVIYFPGVLTQMWTWLKGAFAFLAKLKIPWWGWTLIAVGLAAAIDPEGTASVITSVGEWVGDTIGSIIGSVASGIFSSPWLIAALIFVIWWFFLRKKDDPGVGQPPIRNLEAPAPHAQVSLPAPTISADKFAKDTENARLAGFKS